MLACGSHGNERTAMRANDAHRAWHARDASDACDAHRAHETLDGSRPTSSETAEMRTGLIATSTATRATAWGGASACPCSTRRYQHA